MTRTQGLFDAGNVRLQSGRTFRNMKLSYATYGTLNAARDNVILYPTSYGAQHQEVEFMVGPGAALDTDRYFVIIVDLFGNGLSSSPSNTPWPDTGDRYPHVTVFDAVHVQRRMLRELWGIERIALVYGWSMGAMQAYHWAALFPEAVPKAAILCGAARCAPHNRVFIEGIEAALKADPAWIDGAFREVPRRGLRAMGRIYAGWALSQDFYRAEEWRKLGATSLEDYVITFWEGHFSRRDASDLLAQFWTWKHGDISANEQFDGDFAAALTAIRARVLLMPGDRDLYFRVADNQNELRHLGSASLVEIPSIWGHRAGHPANQPDDRAFIERHVRELLEA
ncbi:alpha/beta fold hydrolase [Alloyangia pacifica]|uniref:Homoserine O-acetyltransferase n=1 Tax=Alloyangia pacifica TaxID=311180 RepID=A0A1I6VH64_9RHOB|nr:alpha/beta fold hydrolase [Alloyangia pacifica]SDH97749.1 homoserine O-acetyltransferase [Alloyangia pacifica]SFT13000.1 homoserine O-acetyltransferase [Alloyangia pacifica]